MSACDYMSSEYIVLRETLTAQAMHAHGVCGLKGAPKPKDAALLGAWDAERKLEGGRWTSARYLYACRAVELLNPTLRGFDIGATSRPASPT